MAVTLTELIIGDEPAAWAAAGFSVDADRTALGSVQVRFAPGRERGVLGWTLAGLADRFTGDRLDGLRTTAVPAAPTSAAASAEHPNGTVALDHVVVATPDLERSISALEAAGLEARRTREAGTADAPRRQVFFWLGEPILELVGPPEPRGDGPATIWGLACTVADIDATAAELDGRVGRVKDAVQSGRRITTLRHRDLDISVPIAFMSAHVPTGASDG
ncbi:MAG: VOC family protein [Acidimicrobiales bacterium]